MNGTAFTLGTFAKQGGGSFAAIVLGDTAVDLPAAQTAYRSSARKGALSSTGSIDGLLENWDANFSVLQEIVAYIEKEGLPPGAAKMSSPPARRLRKPSA